MICVHDEHGICKVATRLAGLPVLRVDGACVACKLDVVPMATNRVTASIASAAQKRIRGHADLDLLRMATGRFHKAGYVLERYIHQWLRFLKITPPVNCGCEEWIVKMNAWGVQGSLDHIDEIVEHLANSLKTTYLAGISGVVSRVIIYRAVRRCLSRELLLSASRSEPTG